MAISSTAWHARLKPTNSRRAPRCTTEVSIRDRGGALSIDRTSTSRHVQQSARTTPRTATAGTVGYTGFEIAARANTRTSSVRLTTAALVAATLRYVAVSRNGLRTIASSAHSTPIGAILIAPSAPRLVTMDSTITTETQDHESSRGGFGLRSLCEPHVVGDRVIGRSQIPPRQRPLLSIRLAERHGETRARELATQVERVHRLGDFELGEQVREASGIGAANEPLVVQDRNPLAIREDTEVRVGDSHLERAQVLLAERQHRRVFHRDEPVVDALGDRVPRDGVVHQASRHVDLAYRPASPRDHFRRQHGPHAQLLADGDQERVDAGRIGRRQLR